MTDEPCCPENAMGCCCHCDGPPPEVTITPVDPSEPLPADCPLVEQQKISAKRQTWLRRKKAEEEAAKDRKAEVLSGILRRMTPKEHKRFVRALVASKRVEVNVA